MRRALVARRRRADPPPLPGAGPPTPPPRSWWRPSLGWSNNPFLARKSSVFGAENAQNGHTRACAVFCPRGVARTSGELNFDFKKSRAGFF